MAVARLGAGLVARGQRSRPVDFRPLCQPRHDLRPARTRPSGGRCHRPRLQPARARGHRPLGRVPVRGALGALLDVDGRSHRATLGVGAGEVFRDLQPRILSGEGGGPAAGSAGTPAGRARPVAAGQVRMEAAGVWMLLAVGVVLLGTGLPAFAVLMGVSVLFAAIGLATGTLELPLLTALPSRIIGLLENDLLQALPLYVFMGALLYRLPLSDPLFRCGVALGGRSRAAPALATLGLCAPLSPLKGPCR